MRRPALISLCLLLAKPFYAAGAEAAPDKLVFAVPTATAASIQGPWLELIYRDVFSRLGIEITILPLPTKRASVMAAEGLVDGELHRSKSYAADHPNMVRVEQSHFAARYAFYTKQPDLPLTNNWESLKENRLRVTYILGGVTPAAKLPSLVAAERLSTVTEAQHGLLKLQHDRTDVLVGFDLIIDPLLDVAEYKQFRIRKAAMMEEVDGYIYLQKKHAALAPKVATILAQMKRDHLIEKYGEQARLSWRPVRVSGNLQ